MCADRMLFQFQDIHPQYASHRIAQRSRAHIPLLHMPVMPCKEKDPAGHARVVLLLLKPFREFSDLCPKNSTWNQSLASFEHELEHGSASNARLVRLIENFEA